MNHKTAAPFACIVIGHTNLNREITNNGISMLTIHLAGSRTRDGG